MKKIVALLLCVVLTLVAGACAKNVDPKQAYQAAYEKTGQLESTDMTTKFKLNMQQAEQTMDISVQADSKMVKKGENDLDMQMKLTMGMLGITYEFTMYYTDGYCYVDMLGQKIKAKMDLSKVMEMAESVGKSVKITSDMLQDVKVEKDGSDAVFQYTLKAEDMKKLMQEMMSNIAEDEDPFAEEEITFEDIKATSVLNKDGYLSSQKFSFTCKSTEEDGTITMESENTINNPGQAVTIEMPDFSGYTEVDESQLDGMFAA